MIELCFIPKWIKNKVNFVSCHFRCAKPYALKRGKEILFCLNLNLAKLAGFMACQQLLGSLSSG